MRIAIAFSIVCSVILLGSAAVTAAPLALSGHAAAIKTAGDTNAMVETVARRTKTRRKRRRYQRAGGWQCVSLLAPLSIPLLAVLFPARRAALLERGVALQ